MIKRIWKTSTILKTLGLIFIEVLFLLLRWFWLSSYTEGYDDLFSWIRFAVLDPGVFSLVNITSLLTISSVLGNQLHERLSENRLEILTRKGIARSLLSESAVLVIKVLCLEVLLTAGTVILSLVSGKELPVIRWEVYLPLQGAAIGISIFHILLMDMLRCVTTSEISMMVMGFLLVLEMGLSYAGITWIPLFSVSYDLVLKSGWNVSGALPSCFFILWAEMIAGWVVWAGIRSRSDLL